ncbi:MAG: hypothetical protein H0Z40_01600 [Desulfotomaculum sp.]|nr:hypothetical protein [Desulfotomaculum sp.]
MRIQIETWKDKIHVLLSTELGQYMPVEMKNVFLKYENPTFIESRGQFEREWLGFYINQTFEDVNHVVRTLNKAGFSAGPLIDVWKSLREE